MRTNYDYRLDPPDNEFCPYCGEHNMDCVCYEYEGDEYNECPDPDIVADKYFGDYS